MKKTHILKDLIIWVEKAQLSSSSSHNSSSGWVSISLILILFLPSLFRVFSMKFLAMGSFTHPKSIS